jgi:hypothetical protein
MFRVWPCLWPSEGMHLPQIRESKNVAETCLTQVSGPVIIRVALPGRVGVTAGNSPAECVMRFTIRQSAALVAALAYTAVMVAGSSLHFAAGCDHSQAGCSTHSHCCHSHGHSDGDPQSVPGNEHRDAPAHDSDNCVICTFHHLGQISPRPVSLPTVEPLCEPAARRPQHLYVRAQRALCRSRAPPA